MEVSYAYAHHHSPHHHHHHHHQSISTIIRIRLPPTLRRRHINIIQRKRSPVVTAAAAAAAKKKKAEAEQAGGKMVVELVGAFNQLTERSRMKSCHHLLIFNTLKLSIPLLQSLPPLSLSPHARSPLSRALSVAHILLHLQMDAQVISAAILIQVLEAAQISIFQVRQRIGVGVAHLLHETLRVKNNIPSKVEVLDDDTAAALRKFCLTYYDIRALILDLALKLDTMRHLQFLPRFQQQLLSLQVMKIHAPLAHAVGTRTLSLELEDLSFRYLFPHSYFYLETWLRSHETTLLHIYKEQLAQSLRTDPLLADMVDDISVNGRYKSRYSTMKKLLRDGRQPEEVNDVLGLRVILKPRPGDGDNASEVGEEACYRTRVIIKSLWKEMPHRSKDYISKPKANGYKSLHMAVDVSENGRTRPLMEIQIRTMEMDMLAAAGSASHSLYKGGLTDPEEAKRLKAIMMAAAEVAAVHLQDIPSTNHKGIEIDQRDRVFCLLDKNGDGRISIGELMEVMEELGAPGDDAYEMMQLLDSNSDGSLSSEEFDLFQKQVEFMRNLEVRDDQYKTMLDEKLHLADDSGLIQVYRKELGSSLSMN